MTNCQALDDMCHVRSSLFLIVFLSLLLSNNLKLKLSVNSILGMSFFSNVSDCSERSRQPLMQAVITQELEPISDLLVSHTRGSQS